MTMNPYSNARMLAFAVERARTRPDYLAWVLAQYREIEHLSASDLAKFLKIRMSQLPQLGLCLRPRRDHFTADVEQISSKFGVDSFALAKVVRLVESVSVMAMEEADSRDSGVLMAARARKDKRKLRDEAGSHDEQSKS
jgi:hypothetical protein